MPAKSGVSGAMIVVVPNIMGICLYSPLLDEMGNSSRGVAFCKVSKFFYLKLILKLFRLGAY